ncbi:MAG: OmpA family protein [Chryseolinea sp.]
MATSFNNRKGIVWGRAPLYLKMRFFLTVIFFATLSHVLRAQDAGSIKALKEEADGYFDREQYNLAIQDYRELADQDVKDAEVHYRLAECYRKTFNYTEAEVYYLKVYFLSPEQFPLSLYYYALMLKFNASFDESIQYFAEFINAHSTSKDLKEFVEQAIIDRSGAETAKEELRSGDGIFPSVALKINTSYNDFAPAVRDSTTMVISSGRIFSNRQSIDERFGEAFTDNYYFEKQAGTWTDKTKQVFSVTNTRFNDGSGCFNSKGDKYFFTVCGIDGPHCRIFLTQNQNGKWSAPAALNANINFKTYESRQPAISYGGDSLIFATNRPGGSGGYDLWMSINSGDENWGPAKNLGVSVNTKLNELAPAFTSFPNVLFFASDGHEGFGGMDLYMSKRLSTGENILYNLGSPFNSNRDDCFISFSEHELYWSSNRQEGLGGFDILGVKITSIPAFISKLSSRKRNARRDINLKQKTEEAQRLNLQASRLEEKIDYDKLSYEKKKIVDDIVRTTESNPNATAAQYKVSAEEFERLKSIAEVRIKENELSARGFLKRIVSPASESGDVIITGILKDSLTGGLLKYHVIVLTDTRGEVVKTTRTNDEGKFRFTGMEAGEFNVQLGKADNDINVNPVLTEFSLTIPQRVQIVQTENIYFDFDHYRIRPEGQNVLDELVSYLKQNTGAQLEIFAFADDRGTSEYNLKLTQKRGQSVAEYLVNKGVDQTGIAIVAKGKQSPKEVDVELQRQYNRRVEFYLNSNSTQFKEGAKTYILKKQVDWKSLSQLTGVSLQDLKTLNGPMTEQPKAFQPVRLPVNAKTNFADLFFTGL